VVAESDDDASGDGGFMSRWSARKVQARRGGAVPAEAPAVIEPEPVAAAALPASTTTAAAPHAAPAQTAESQAPPAPPAPPPPTLEDVAALTAESDFSRFVARDVEPGVRNAAMKKLFAAPSFNTMDGLDVYTEDFNTFVPLPKSTLRQLLQARVLGLLDDELKEQPLPPDDAPPTTAALEAEGNDAVAALEPPPAPDSPAADALPRADAGPMPSDRPGPEQG
jgi:hypothetical protein